PPECGVQRAFFKDQGMVTLMPDQVCNGVTMKRPPRQSLEDQNIQRAAQKLEFRAVAHSFAYVFQGEASHSSPMNARGISGKHYISYRLTVITRDHDHA